jgi:GNAT superfamily N-acetyltransferase
MEIRLARDTDFEGFCRLVAELDSLHEKNVPRYYRMSSVPPRSKDFFSSLITNPAKAVLLAVQGDEMAGYLYLEARTEPPVPVLVPMQWANILETVVTKKFQRQGVGKLLMEHARRWAKENGCRDLRLSVFEFNEAAQAFYKSEGFFMRNHIMALPLD